MAARPSIQLPHRAPAKHGIPPKELLPQNKEVKQNQEKNKYTLGMQPAQDSLNRVDVISQYFVPTKNTSE